MHRIIIGAGIFAVWLTGSASALAQDCDPLKPSRAIDVEVRRATEANAGVLRRALLSGDIKDEYERMERNQEFSNPDDMHRWNSFIFLLCTSMERSSLSDHEKIRIILGLRELSEQGPPGFGREHDVPATPSTPTSTVLFQDDFETDIDPNWVINGDNFSIVSGQLHSAGWFTAYVGDTSWDDYTVEFDLEVHNTGVRVLVRRQNDADYMAWEMREDCEFKWLIVSNGNEQEVPNSETDVSDHPSRCTGHYVIVANGSRYEVSKNGSRVFSLSNNAFRNGNVGLAATRRRANFAVDNFKVKALR